MIKTHTEITTERLVLRELNPEVCHWLFEEASRPERMRFLGCWNDTDLREETLRFRDCFVQNARFSFRHWLLLMPSTGEVIGDGGFHLWHVQDFRAELGYGMRTDLWKNQGLMTEAISKMLEIGFLDMQLHRVETFIHPHNTPSIRIMRRFGFRQEGTLRGHSRSNGHWDDALAFSLLRREWEQAREYLPPSGIRNT